MSNEKADLEMTEEEIVLNDGIKWWRRRRSSIAFLLFWGFFISFICRINIGIALVAMTRPIQKEKDMEMQPSEFDWDLINQGHILSAFYYGFLLTQMLGGWLSYRFGGHIVMTISVGIPSLLALLLPLMVRLGFIGIMINRIISGFFMGFILQANQEIWAHWSPPFEKSCIMNFINSGNLYGTVFINLIGGFLAKYYGWEMIFYIPGVIGILWALIWFFIGSNDPVTDKFITLNEKNYIMKQLKKVDCNKNRRFQAPPWKNILRTPAIWAHLSITCGSFWCFNIFQNQMPAFLKDILHFEIESVGYICALGDVIKAITFQLSGVITDHILLQGILTTTKVRKISLITGTSGLLFALLTVIVNDRIGIVVCLTIAQTLNFFIYGVSIVNLLDLSRKHASVISGFSNTFGGISAVIGLVLTGYLTQDKTFAGWMHVFLISTGISLTTTIIFCVIGSGEQQPWANDS